MFDSFLWCRSDLGPPSPKERAHFEGSSLKKWLPKCTCELTTGSCVHEGFQLSFAILCVLNTYPGSNLKVGCSKDIVASRGVVESVSVVVWLPTPVLSIMYLPSAAKPSPFRHRSGSPGEITASKVTPCGISLDFRYLTWATQVLSWFLRFKTKHTCLSTMRNRPTLPGLPENPDHQQSRVHRNTADKATSGDWDCSPPPPTPQ